VIEIARLTWLPTIKINPPPEKPKVKPGANPPMQPMQDDRHTPGGNREVYESSVA
jgi:hypothetical protein